MGREPGDHRNAEPVQVIGELIQLGTVDAGIDQDQPILPAHHDGIRPDPLALPNPDAVGHPSQHRFTLSSSSPRRKRRARPHSSRVIVAARRDSSGAPRRRRALNISYPRISTSATATEHARSAGTAQLRAEER